MDEMLLFENVVLSMTLIERRPEHFRAPAITAPWLLDTELLKNRDDRIVKSPSPQTTTAPDAARDEEDHTELDSNRQSEIVMFSTFVTYNAPPSTHVNSDRTELLRNVQPENDRWWRSFAYIAPPLLLIVA